ncbi:MAG TPA: thioredoxin [Micromonosporaceae bacterium]
MATKNLTKAEFEKLSEASGITLVDFWADWCVPCHRFAPVFEKVSENHSDITFAKVDTEAEVALAAELDISSIPTIMAIRDGVVVFQQAGALPEPLLENLITKVRELDMDEVRAQAA